MDISVARKPRNYWRNLPNIKKEIQEYIDIFGGIPNTGFYLRVGRDDLCSAICRYGIKKLSYDLNIPIVMTKDKQSNCQKKIGYWRNWDNVIKEIEPIVKEFGTIPSELVMRQRKLYSLSYAINFFGGLPEVRKKLGLPLHPHKKRHPLAEKYWESLENMKQRLQPLIEEYGTIPASRIVKKKLGDRADKSIRSNFGGYVNFRKKLNIPMWKPEYSGCCPYRKNAIKTYGKKCLVCGYDTIIVVHHIDGDRLNNDVNNLIVVCANHHLEMHANIIDAKYYIEKFLAGEKNEMP